MPQKAYSLSSFLSALFQSGEVLVKNQLEPFPGEDLMQAGQILAQIHNEEQLNTPKDSINFDPTAALWAAQFLYRAIQITLLRELDEKTIKQELKLYTGRIDAASICSADLCLRYLFDLFKLTKGLAPGDILLRYLEKVAFQWPYSAIAWATLPHKEQLFEILKHEGLRLLFLERLIERKAYTEIERLQLIPWIYTLTGLYPEQLLPDVFNSLNDENEHAAN